MRLIDSPFVSTAIGRIYDCAIDFESWDPALELLRERLDAPFAAVHMITCTPDTPQQRMLPEVAALHTQWEERWVHMLPMAMEGIPQIERLKSVEVDEPVIHSEVIGPQIYAQSDFMARWLAPQGLADGCTTTVLRRANETAMISIPIAEGSAPPDEETRGLIRLLAPHFRRALLISDMLDVHKQKGQLIGAMLDYVALPVFLVSTGARIVYTNAEGEALLEQGAGLEGTGGTLRARRGSDAEAFGVAVERACSGDDTVMGLWGNGMVLSNETDEAVVAYILPLGRSEIRHALGSGMAAVFVSRGTASMPLPIEVLTAFSGLTTAEARVALCISEGMPLDAIARDRDVSVLTVRKQLANIFDKVGVRNQTGLGAFVNRLRVPLRPAAAPGQTED